MANNSIPHAPLEEIVQLELPWQKKALLILTDKDYHPDISLIKEVLEERGYVSTILDSDNADPDSILEEIAAFARNSHHEPETVIYYSGHGDDEGLAIETDDGLRYVTPEQLFEAVGHISGKKAVILDSCHSGIFVNYIKDHGTEATEPHAPQPKKPHHGLSDYLVMSACPAKALAIGFKNSPSAFTKALHQTLQNSSRKIELSQANIRPELPLTPMEALGNLLKRLRGSGYYSANTQRAADIEFYL